MDAWAMEALVVVLDDPLPVRGDDVVHLAGTAELGGAIALQVLEQVADVLGGIGRVTPEVDQQQPPNRREAHRDEAVAGGIEVLDPVHVRTGAEGATGAWGPGGVGTR